MLNNFESRPVYVRTNDRIDAHFATCFLALVLMRLLEQRISHKYPAGQILESIKNTTALILIRTTGSSHTLMRSLKPLEKYSAWNSTRNTEHSEKGEAAAVNKNTVKKQSLAGMDINTPYRRSGANPYKHWDCAYFASKLEISIIVKNCVPSYFVILYKNDIGIKTCHIYWLSLLLWFCP